MDAIGITSLVATPAQTPALPPQVTQPSVPAAAPAPTPAQPNDSNNEQSFDAQAAEQKRLEMVQQQSQQYIADFYPVSDQVFTIYKDSSGQYITRFRSLLDGKVTYIPQPSLPSLQNSSVGTVPLLNISA